MEKNKLNINTKIVAEIANSHQGSMLNAINLANKCIVSGADAVKFQVYSAKELLHTSHKRYDHFKKQSFNLNQWNNIFKKIKKKNQKYFVMYLEKNLLQSLTIIKWMDLKFIHLI